MVGADEDSEVGIVTSNVFEVDTTVPVEVDATVPAESCLEKKKR